MDIKRFGLYCARLRDVRGYKTQKDLALDAGISPATLSRIEAGTHKAEPETLKKLAPFLNVPYGILMVAAGYLPGNVDANDDGSLNLIVPVRAERIVETLAHARGLSDADYDMITDQVERLVAYAQQKKRNTSKTGPKGKDDN